MALVPHEYTAESALGLGRGRLRAPGYGVEETLQSSVQYENEQLQTYMIISSVGPGRTVFCGAGRLSGRSMVLANRQLRVGHLHAYGRNRELGTQEPRGLGGT
jgi:hypothetical protein